MPSCRKREDSNTNTCVKRNKPWLLSNTSAAIRAYFSGIFVSNILRPRFHQIFELPLCRCQTRLSKTHTIATRAYPVSGTLFVPERTPNRPSAETALPNLWAAFSFQLCGYHTQKLTDLQDGFLYKKSNMKLWRITKNSYFLSSFSSSLSWQRKELRR